MSAPSTLPLAARDRNQVSRAFCAGFVSLRWLSRDKPDQAEADGDHWYKYPRYFFSNESTDILGLCGQALDRLGVSWRFSRRNTISVARRAAVARLDEFVGPKF